MNWEFWLRRRFHRVVMSRKQLIALWSGIACFVISGLFPPWSYRFEDGQSRFAVPREYRFIATPPLPTGRTGPIIIEIDVTRLCIQWLIIFAVTCATIVTLRRPHE
jgi:hypothetical protein